MIVRQSGTGVREEDGSELGVILVVGDGNSSINTPVVFIRSQPRAAQEEEPEMVTSFVLLLIHNERMFIMR